MSLRVGPTRFELVTSSLSGTRSNQLSYEPARRGERRILRPARGQRFSARRESAQVDEQRRNAFTGEQQGARSLLSRLSHRGEEGPRRFSPAAVERATGKPR